MCSSTCCFSTGRGDANGSGDKCRLAKRVALLQNVRLRAAECSCTGQMPRVAFQGIRP